MTRADYQQAGLSAEARARDLLERMTPEEKVAQLASVWLARALDGKRRSLEEIEPGLSNGIGQICRVTGSGPLTPREGAELANALQRLLLERTRLGVPAIVHEECLAGLMAQGATVFPQAINLACAFDPDLVERITSVIRRQMRSLGAHQGLAPVLDVARDPRWGRIEETFGEDPYLVARVGAAYVRGLQGADWRSGVVATPKHFAAYGVCEGGRNLAPAHVGPRELRDVFLFPFEVAVREAGAASIMNAYQEIDGIPAAASRELFTEILRDEWQFEGTVVSDYFAIEFLQLLHRVAEDESQAAVLGLEAGIDVELPNQRCYGEPLLRAIREGRLSTELVDSAVTRVLEWKFRLGLFEHPYVDTDAAAVSLDTPADRELAREAAVRSIVLLRNEGGLLPLRSSRLNLAVIGPNADAELALFGDYHFSNQLGLDEASVEAPSLLRSIRARLPVDCEVRHAPGCSVEDLSTAGFDEALQVASNSDVALLVLGDRSGALRTGTVGEHRDSDTLALPGVQEELLRRVHETGTPIVLVLMNGRPVASEWIAENVPAIVEAWFPGEEGGAALADILFGERSPTGRLCVTFPRRPGHVPVFYSSKFLSRKDYTTSSIEPLFAFGHGLSYASFEYSDFSIRPETTAPDGEVEVVCRVANVGDRPAEEVVQLYVRDRIASCTRPVQELKGFVRVPLRPGESRIVHFRLPADLLAFHDPGMRLVVEPGEFEVRVGHSSADIRLTGTFRVDGEIRIIRGARRYETGVRVDAPSTES
ncbi:MAG: glycoside hydrolase family 3 N-terminal domain-containing protein [Myxococcota bacterium]